MAPRIPSFFTATPPPTTSRTRSPTGNRKTPISIRLDDDLVVHFRSTGEGWQARMNAILRKEAGI